MTTFEIVETLCHPFLFHPLLNVLQHKFQQLQNQRLCLWYHPSLQWTTCSKLTVEAKEQDVMKIKNDAACSMLATKGQEQGVKTVQD